jgi:hypothetical protein
MCALALATSPATAASRFHLPPQSFGAPLRPHGQWRATAYSALRVPHLRTADHRQGTVAPDLSR